jgi:predicted secreted hydrolase
MFFYEKNFLYSTPVDSSLMPMNLSLFTKSKRKNVDLEAEEIVPQDDAFHGVVSLADVEWWYFDAIFENGYSVHVGVRIFHSRGRSGIVRARFEIYKDGLVEAAAVKTALLKDLRISQVEPLIHFDEHNKITFDENRYKTTGEWVYTVSFQIESHAVSLTFTGNTKGWKIETPRNSWAVALPKARVDGTIRLHDTVIPVHGIGYHDHNWDYSLLTTWMRNTGWFWGRIIGQTGTMIWAQTIEKKEKKNIIVVINQESKGTGEKEFITIPPRDIAFSVSKYVQDHGRWVPTDFSFDISHVPSSNHTVPVDIHLTLRTNEIHHTRILAVHYWRYHVKTNGTLSIGSLNDRFDDKMQIIELVCFKTLQRE